MTLSRDSMLAAILATTASDVVAVDVPDLPEFGGRVYLRPISGADASAIYTTERSNADIVQAVVVCSLCTEQGERVGKVEHAPALFAKPNHALQPIITKALDINRMTKESADAARKE